MERAWGCRRDGRAANRLLPVPNAAGRFLVRAAAAALVAAAAGGCSLSFPVKGIETDASPTGSVDRAALLLSSPLDGEDLRRAKAAMATALDPQGNGARVAWQNPQTGAKGAFVAAHPPYPDHDRVCRAFTGEVATASSAERAVRGAACRDGDGAWLVQGGV